MKTVLTFGGLYRKEPLVFVTERTKFLVLISESKGVCITESWCAASGDLRGVRPDLALVVQCLETENKKWQLSIHPDSPVTEISQVGLSRWNGRPKLISDARLGSTWAVGDGEVVRFEMAQVPSDKIVQVMFSVWEEPADGSDNPQAVNLSGLPDLVLTKILGHLPTYEVLENIPFVAVGLHPLVTSAADGAWKKLEFVYGLPCLKELTAICKAACGACTEIVWEVPAGKKEEDPGKFKLGALLVNSSWSQVEKLRLDGSIPGLDEPLLGLILRKGNFPSLRTLELVLPNGKITWKVFERANLPLLKELVIAISRKTDPTATYAQHRNMPESVPIAFKSLEKLHVFEVQRKPRRGQISLVIGENREIPIVTRALADSATGLSNLQELKLVQSTEIKSILAVLFKHTALKRLAIESSDLPDSYYKTQNCDLAKRWFARFPELESLVLDGSYRLNWDGADLASLEKLKSVRLALPLDAEQPSVPFDKMVNLENVWVRLGNACVIGQHMKWLLELSKLRCLKLELSHFASNVKSLVKCVTVSPGGSELPKPSLICKGPVEALELEFMDGYLRQNVVEDLSRILSSFPNVVRMSLTCKCLLSVRAMAGLVANDVKKLVRLEIRTRGCEAMMEAGEDGLVPAYFGNKISSLKDQLGTGWTVMRLEKRKGTKYKMQAAALQREQYEHRPKSELQPFEGPFFNMRRINFTVDAAEERGELGDNSYESDSSDGVIDMVDLVGEIMGYHSDSDDYGDDYDDYSGDDSSDP